MTGPPPDTTAPTAATSKPRNNLLSSRHHKALSPPSPNPCLKPQCLQHGARLGLPGSAAPEDGLSGVPQLVDGSAQPRGAGVTPCSARLRHTLRKLTACFHSSSLRTDPGGGATMHPMLQTGQLKPREGGSPAQRRPDTPKCPNTPALGHSLAVCILLNTAHGSGAGGGGRGAITGAHMLGKAARGRCMHRRERGGKAEKASFGQTSTSAGQHRRGRWTL